MALDASPLRSRVFCTFPDCIECGQFFRESYTRNYKPNGIKVLRCFPHCCPDHIPHSSCGTSVVMQVAGHFTAAEMESVVAFGRFETCVEPSLPLGYQLVLEEVAASKHVWFPSTPSTDLNQNLIMFTFKDKLSDPWHYGWTSGASSALRTTQHAFKAYLFEMVPGTRMIQVVGIAQSPGFIIIPYKPLGAGDAEPDPTNEQQEATAPQVATAFDCTFVACQCEKPMFGDNYIRYKVSRSLWTSLVFQQMQPSEWKKATEVGADQGLSLENISRCFPHCCPDHILHCSCGGPIMISVDLAHSPALARPSKEIVMYAHGERWNMPELHIDDVITHDTIVSRLHHSGNERGDWVKGVVQPGLSTATTLLFNFNQNSRHTGWPYNWKGSATKVDRNRKHVFKAYVFQVLRGGSSLRVLNWISSTPFTMSSFRRCNTTPTSRTNSYIEVKPTEIIDQPVVPRKRSHENVESPPSALKDIHSAG
ncbi:hypothetical protein AeRB84_005900 [Aphanomyces euteiches]|nr:hypothetical protein AeRB84_005900 [Aphanomyces euteiches]